MKNLNKIISFVVDKKSIFILITLYFFLENTILSLYREFIIVKFLTKFDNSTINDFLFFAISLFVFLWCINKIRMGFYIKLDNLISSFVLLVFYTYIRIKFVDDLLPLKYLSYFKYTDIFYVIICSLLTVGILFYIKQNKKKKKVRNDEDRKIHLYSDAPEKYSSNDLIERKVLASKASRFIKSNYNNEESIAVGIVGKWGDGKTTFMNFMEESFINDERYIIVPFKSWHNITVNSIINDFFTTVENHLRPYSVDISREIKKYGKSVLPIYKSSVTEVVLNSLDLISEKSVSENFDEIEKLLVKLDKKVLVFFDDVDRLNPNEVFEVLKLIRNTASFKTFNYIVGYDRDYLIKALENQNIPNADNYCDKIFISEFQLLPLTKSQIINFIKENLYLNYGDDVDSIERIFENFQIYSRIQGGEVFSSIKNFRQAKRFLNEFSISINLVSEDVDFGNFLILKLIKFSYYDAYFQIFINKNRYIGNTNDYSRNSGIRRIALAAKNKNVSYEFKDSLIEEFLVSKNIYNEEQLRNLGVLFRLLFLEAPHSRLSIGFNHNYGKYFRDELEDSEISDKEYKNAIYLSWKLLNDCITKWEEKGQLYSILPHLYHTNSMEFAEKINFENYIKMLFLLQKNESKREDLKYFNVDYEYIHSCLFHEGMKKVEKYYSGQLNEYKSFIMQLFFPGTYPFTFEMNFCKYIYESIYIESQNEIFSKNELENFLTDFFQKIVDKMEYWDNNIFDAFWKTVLKGNEKINDNTWKDKEIILPQVVDIFKSVIKKYPDEFFVEIIEKAKGESKKVKIGAFIYILFSSNQEFIDFINNSITNDKSRFKEEFLRFADVALSENTFVDFNFQYERAKLLFH